MSFDLDIATRRRPDASLIDLPGSDATVTRLEPGLQIPPLYAS